MRTQATRRTLTSTKYVVEHNVPFPDTYRRRTYPFSDMQVGDSFRTDSEDRNRVTSAASYYGKRNGMKFSVRAEQNGGVRIFRIE